MPEVAIFPGASAQGTYALGETTHLTVTFKEVVTGAPRLKIRVDPEWGDSGRTAIAATARRP